VRVSPAPEKGDVGFEGRSVEGGGPTEVKTRARWGGAVETPVVGGGSWRSGHQGQAPSMLTRKKTMWREVYVVTVGSTRAACYTNNART
jgi:hypothetical protein